MTATNPPLIILGGAENALSIVRSFARRPVEVVLVNAGWRSAFRTRAPFRAFRRPAGLSASEHYSEVLLSASRALDGGVVLACGDDAIEFIGNNRPALEARYRLDWHIPVLQTAMLDKEQTMRLAQEHGIDCPRFRRVTTMEEVAEAAAEFEYPVLLKPTHSHLFQEHFSTKLLLARSRAELLTLAERPLSLGLGMILSEFIPGPDSRLSSYYTHLDADLRPLFHFTKRVIRRSQVHFGRGCYHETRWLPETAALGQALFKRVGFTGLGNVEFKSDPRDGRLKIIEVNARITAANELLVAAGLDIPWLIYNRLLGRPTPDPDTRYRDGLTLWYPMADFDSYRELRTCGQLDLGGWIRSVSRPQVLPWFRMSDPAPALHHAARELHQRVGGRLSRVVSRR